MKKLFAFALLAITIGSDPSFAETTQPVASAPKFSNQADKMKACAEEYKHKNMPKAEYRKFMSTCLKKDYQPGSYIPGQSSAVDQMNKQTAPGMSAPPGTTATTAAPTANSAQLGQREKMKNCNIAANDKTLQGDQRKSFIKACLSAR